MSLHLPLHPTKRHPLTGEPLRAVYVTFDGQPKWPIMGGAPDDDDAAAKAAADAAAKAAADADEAAKKAAADAAAAEKDKDLGFPKDTPVVEMTAAQQAAYWQHQSRKHETRASEYRQAAGGKSAAEIKADLEAAETLRREKLSADEKAIEDAASKAREEANREYGPKAVRTALQLLLGDMPEAEQNAEIELLDLSKFLTESGDVDTAKVRRHAQKIAPAGKGPGGRREFDFGGGKRGDDGPKAGSVAAVMAERRAARESKSKS